MILLLPFLLHLVPFALALLGTAELKEKQAERALNKVILVLGFFLSAIGAGVTIAQKLNGKV